MYAYAPQFVIIDQHVLIRVTHGGGSQRGGHAAFIQRHKGVEIVRPRRGNAERQNAPLVVPVVSKQLLRLVLA